MSWLDRQSFLGPASEQRLDEAGIGLVGVGGGNSHVAQQLAHVGIGHFVLVDDDAISLTNLNRLVGGTRDDVDREMPKVEILRRVILAVNPKARVEIYQTKWQVAGDALKLCDVIVGGVDNVRAKYELDGFCRRFLIPYVDQGMDVHKHGCGTEFLVAGQVVLSGPGGPCLKCLGLVSDEALEQEARNYGDAGGKPQVVWSNGVLASTVVGLVVQLLTPWHRKGRLAAYLEYDGNKGTVIESQKLKLWRDRPCPHYPPMAVGDPTFDVRR